MLPRCRFPLSLRGPSRVRLRRALPPGASALRQPRPRPSRCQPRRARAVRALPRPAPAQPARSARPPHSLRSLPRPSPLFAFHRRGPGRPCPSLSSRRGRHFCCPRGGLWERGGCGRSGADRLGPVPRAGAAPRKQEAAAAAPERRRQRGCGAGTAGTRLGSARPSERRRWRRAAGWCRRRGRRRWRSPRAVPTRPGCPEPP